MRVAPSTFEPRRPARAPHRRALALAILLVAGLAACRASGTEAAPAAGPAATTTTPAAGPAATTTAVAAAAATVSLLQAVDRTILGQPIVYPGAVPAQVSSAIITLAPGQETGRHRHDAPMYAYILEGEVTVDYDGGVTKTYPAGSALIEAVGTAHNGRSTGTVPVRILVVNIGAEGVANTVRL